MRIFQGQGFSQIDLTLILILKKGAIVINILQIILNNRYNCDK